MITEKISCWICASKKFIDYHHVDCQEGKLSPETVPLCRRCHRTFHDLGVDYFDDEYLDKAIELENRRRKIHNCNIEYLKEKGLLEPLPPLRREDIKRTSYFNKKHGIKDKRDNRGIMTPVLAFRLPRGEPLCGWGWVNAHLYDLMDWVPRIEVVRSGVSVVSADIDNAKKFKDTLKSLRGLRKLPEE